MDLRRLAIFADGIAPDSARGIGLKGTFSAWLEGLRADSGNFSLKARAMRALRRCPALWRSQTLEVLFQSRTYLAHAAAEGGNDPLFFLAHRQYLFRDRSPAWRLLAAAAHYGHESRRFDIAYQNSVYGDGGLTLWRRSIDGVDYAVSLCRGADVAYEGGLSLVFLADSARICVMSLSLLECALLDGGAALPGPVVYAVTRKQLTQDRYYQAAFNKAFHRSTPAHLCFGGLAGLAQAQGFDRVFGIAPDWHPSYSADVAAQFQRAYGEFWDSLSARPAGQMGCVIELPLHMKPLNELPANRRKRAIARREVIEEVCASAARVIGSHLCG